jgi:hypothetical protein
MENLKLEKSTAIELFRDKKTPDSLKKILIDTFGEKCFSEKTTDRIKTFEDACVESGVNPVDVINSDYPLDESAYKKLKLIIKVLNEGWVPDWSNSDEAKYYPWFEYARSSGFGFSYSYYYYTLTTTPVGSRLCFKSRELAEYAGKQFIEIYREFLT